MLSRLLSLLPVLVRLGLGSVAHVILVYRFACRSKVYRLMMPIQPWQPNEAFFDPPANEPYNVVSQFRNEILQDADLLVAGKLKYFSFFQKRVGSPPRWFIDPFKDVAVERNKHWSEIDEFSGSDIKIIWEPSRFKWAPLLAQAWQLSKDPLYLNTLNSWLQNWISHNPVNMGPNWKCGQEASIRLINLLLTALLLNAHRNPSPALGRLIRLHCQRISPTIRYAIAQNNNHGTSEAAALFIGGAWLLSNEISAPIKKQALRWRKIGRKWLENQIATLITEDGSFSQYSANYHRVLLDTLCQVELWRRELVEDTFSVRYLRRCRAALDWMAAMTDAASGDAPNLGANDGARLYHLSTNSYRDFRSTIQLSSVLFKERRVYDAGPWDEQLHWLNLTPHDFQKTIDEGSVMHADGGYVVLRSNGLKAIVRFANFRFRPSHADCLHMDLWYRGQDLLRDGGTYSYNTDDRTMDYFSGTASHNTVQFDGRNQMPRISRFLFGNWLKMTEVGQVIIQDGRYSWTGAYRDGYGSEHRRSVEVDGHCCRVVDELRGFRNKAVLRWRLIPAKWHVSGRKCESALGVIDVKTDNVIKRCELVKGWESRHYLEKTELPVFEIEIGASSASIITEIVVKN